MNPKEAKKILPKSEYEAFEAILMNQISRTSAAKLKQRATLSRRLRDKYQDLARHEVAGTRTRKTNEVDTDINDRRARLFQQIIDRLATELDEPRFAKVVQSPGPSPARKKALAQRAAKARGERKVQRQMHEASLREKPPGPAMGERRQKP